MTWKQIVDTEKLDEGEGIVEDGIAVFNTSEGWFAVDNECPHQGGPLARGTLLSDTVVSCPWHGWEFDLETGVSPSHDASINSYDLKVEDGFVYVKKEGESCCDDCCCS